MKRRLHRWLGLRLLDENMRIELADQVGTDRRLYSPRAHARADELGVADSIHIAAIIPAYNEDRFIGSLVLKTLKYADSVIVIDDGSTDRTAEIAEAAGALVARHHENKGKGAALNTGLDMARKLDTDVAAVLDGDGQHHPEEIPDMLKPIVEGGADMVIGSRYLGVKSRIPLYRQFGQAIVTLLTTSMSRVPSSDSWSGFRALSRKALECVRFRETGWGVDPEFQFLAHEHDLTVVEVPIVAVYEEEAKRNPFVHGTKTLNAILRLTGQHRPLFFFGTTGSIFILAGVTSGLWVIDRFTTTLTLPVGIALLTVMLTVIGILALFTGITLHSVRAMIRELARSMQPDE
jgi:glycosyltransferase involved in cell wall biosynthesis